MPCLGLWFYSDSLFAHFLPVVASQVNLQTCSRFSARCTKHTNSQTTASNIKSHILTLISKLWRNIYCIPVYSVIRLLIMTHWKQVNQQENKTNSRNIRGKSLICCIVLSFSLVPVDLCSHVAAEEASVFKGNFHKLPSAFEPQTETRLWNYEEFVLSAEADLKRTSELWSWSFQCESSLCSFSSFISPRFSVQTIITCKLIF